MPLLHVDTHIDLYYPVRAPSAHGIIYATYLSHLEINGSVFPISIAYQVGDPEEQLIPSGTVAHVIGSLSIVNQSLLITASEIMPLYISSTPATRLGLQRLYEPYITAVGIVSSGRIVDFSNPSALIVELTVERMDRWPYTATTIRCIFNRDERRFRTLIPMVRNTPLVVSGTLLGWADGKLAIDIHEVRCNNNGSPPDRPLVTYPNPFQLRAMLDGYAIFDESSAPPPYTRTAPGLVFKTKKPLTIDGFFSDHSVYSEIEHGEQDSRGCSGPASPGRKLVAKRAVADRGVKSRRRGYKVPAASPLGSN